MKLVKIFFLLVFLLLCGLKKSDAQSINKYKKKQRHGKWVIPFHNSDTLIDNTGRYRLGVPKGTWRYYDRNARLIKKEKYVFRKIYTTQYHENGKIKRKGKAKIVINDTMIHYFYYGNWNVYDTAGVLIKKQTYKNGIKTGEQILVKTKGINDSLVKEVKRINDQFYLYSDSLRWAENKYGKNTLMYERYVSLHSLNALKIFTDIDKIIQKFGYPGKTLVGEDYAIVFSIISQGNKKIKEKYYDLIIKAADEKELDWSDVAFFVDKVKVAKKEEQIYGTQFRYNETDFTTTYYPIKDKAQLNERRKKVGLTELDLNKINDTASY
ncbi:MAG: hypothetical protein JNL24_11585 [Bacteroidia bacterium]|nr:hypothetical protein [Bacteroidia bacterium]